MRRSELDDGPDERRRSPRVGARVRVLYFSKGQPRAVEADCENISVHGLFIKTRRRGPEAGTPVSLLLTFAGESEVMVEGVVRWQGSVRSKDGSEGAGMGIEFANVSPEAQQTLERALGAAPEDG